MHRQCIYNNGKKPPWARSSTSRCPFEWDDAKKDANPGKHEGVTFEEAMEAFFDPGARLVDASRRGEARDALIGYGAQSRMLYVVHVEILDGGFRIISARKAEARERALYEDS